MSSATQGVQPPAPDPYVWEVPGKPVAVHIPLSVVDRLSAEIMRGYGANPKRNPEVGGVLIGSVEQGSPAIVRIEDFELVPCQYRRGPSYVFTEEDCDPFEQAGERPDAVGYFRSHTRDGLSLGVEDVDLLDHFFAGPATVALLIKPFATKPCVAGYFIRENGTFPETTPLEFPFRRQELSGEEAPARRSMMERRPRRNRDEVVDQESGQNTEFDFGPPGAPTTLGSPEIFRDEPSLPEPAGFEFPAEQFPPPARSRARSMSRSRMPSGWVWIPLSFVFLLFGVAVGFQAAMLNIGSRPQTAAGDFSLSLVASKVGENLSVRWDRQAPAVQASRRGVLEIEEKGVTKPVELDAAQLRNGTLTYRNATNDVRLRLTVFPKDQVTVMESAEWRQ